MEEFLWESPEQKLKEGILVQLALLLNVCQAKSVAMAQKKLSNTKKEDSSTAILLCPMFVVINYFKSSLKQQNLSFLATFGF